MPSTIILTAVPAIRTRDDDKDTATVIGPFGRKYGLSLIRATTLEQIGDEVRRFASQVHLQFPDASFAITLRIRAGETIPEGFDAARASGAFGQYAFVKHEAETLEAGSNENQE